MKTKKYTTLMCVLCLTACGGGDDVSSQLNSLNQNTLNQNPSTGYESPVINETPYISGQIKGHPTFNIPCHDIALDTRASENDYYETQLESNSTGIIFNIVLPTKNSLYKDALGRYMVKGINNLDESKEQNKFRLFIKVPSGDVTTGERFISTESFDTTTYYSELVSITEESKVKGKVNLLLKFKFNLEMNHYKAGILQLNSELNHGEVHLRVTVENE